MKKFKKDYRTFAHPVDRKHLKYRSARKFLAKNEEILRVSMHKPRPDDWPDFGCCSRDTWKFLGSWLENSVGKSEQELWTKFKDLLRWKSKQERWYWWTWDIDDRELEYPNNTYYFNNKRILCKYDLRKFKRKI